MNPDLAETPVELAISEITDQMLGIHKTVGKVWLAAHKAGMRDGLGSTAIIAQKFAEQYMSKTSLSGEIREEVLIALHVLGEDLRLTSLSMQMEGEK